MRKAITILSRAIVVLVFVLTFADVYAQPANPEFTRTEAMIPMRDGVRLYTQVYTPAKATERLPILFLRTPYGIGDSSSAQLAAALAGISRRWVHHRPAGHSRAVQVGRRVRDAPTAA